MQKKFLFLRNKKFWASTLLSFGLLVLAVLPSVGLADGSFLCSPGEGGGDSDGFYACFNRIYDIAIVVGAIVAVAMIATAGYLYMFSGGNEKNVGKAKDYITTSIIGLVILLGGFLVLKQVNPDILLFRSISPEQIASQSWVLEDGTIVVSKKPPVGGVLLGGIPSGTAQELAKKILANPKITLEDSHVSGVRDNATAKQNIIDTAAGRPASRSSYGNAPGGTIALSEVMLGAVLKLAEKYSFNITEFAGAGHASNSRHYSGIAFDTTIVNGKHIRRDPGGADLIAPFKADCRALGATEVLGPPDDPAIHCGWPRSVVASGGGGGSTAILGSQVKSEKSGKVCDGGRATKGTESPKCSLYETEISNASSQTGLDKSIIRTLIHIESRFQANAGSDRGARGLMQITPSTAIQYSCGAGWETNPSANILCGSRIFKSLINKYGGDVDLAIAEYNGGAEANQQSRDCPGQRRWQCAFDNPEQTVCNDGYLETRNYVLSYKALLPKYQSSCGGQ